MPLYLHITTEEMYFSRIIHTRKCEFNKLLFTNEIMTRVTAYTQFLFLIVVYSPNDEQRCTQI